MDKEDKCRIKWRPDKTLGWMLGFEGNCDKELAQIEAIPGSRGEYLKRRIDHSSDNSST